MTGKTYGPIDAASVYAQIPLRIRMLLGITRSKIVRGETEVMLPIRDSHRQKVIVRLDGNDLYDLEYGRICRYEWEVLGTVEGIGCEQLGDALVRLVEGE